MSEGVQCQRRTDNMVMNSLEPNKKHARLRRYHTKLEALANKKCNQSRSMYMVFVCVCVCVCVCV